MILSMSRPLFVPQRAMAFFMSLGRTETGHRVYTGEIVEAYSVK